MFKIFVLLMTLFSLKNFAQTKICSTVEANSVTQFHCYDQGTGQSFFREVDNISASSIKATMQERGVILVSHGEYLAISTRGLINELAIGPNVLNQSECVSPVYFRVDEFNDLEGDHVAIERVRELARALQEAGVCDLPVIDQDFLNINIETSDDILHQFLCISNKESVFGRDNIGSGGRGPWGIHPMHNLPAGSYVYINGKNTLLTEDGLCYPGQSIVRNSNNEEIKDSDMYLNYAVRLDNAKCAFKLYMTNHSGDGNRGFRDWGRSQSWGSNRFCSESTRDRLEFMKHLGPLGCCTQTCLDRVSTSL